MSVPNRSGVPDKTSQTEQYVLNYSFDELYKILMVGLAAYNSTSGNYDRIQIDDASGGLKISDAQNVVIQNLTDQLAHLTNQLRFLSALQTPTSELRVNVNAGTLPTVTTVTTVSTLTNQSQMGTYLTNNVVMSQMNDYTANALRRNITTT